MSSRRCGSRSRSWARVRARRRHVIVQAAVHDQGVALVWATMVRSELRDGRLVKVFDGRYETSNSYYASCTEGAYGKPKVCAVMDWMTGAALRIEL